MTYEIGELNHETLLGPLAAAEDALARLDERVARSEVGPGFAERADFFESVSSMWVGGELVHLEDLVLHDAQMDIRAPSHELVIAHRIVRARRRVSRNDPGWAVSRSGIMALAGLAEGTSVESEPVDGGGEGVELELVGDAALSPELAEIDEVLARTQWLVDGSAAAEQRKREPEISVGELLIRDPDWDEGERIGEWLDLAKSVERLPATLAAALLWDAWEHLEPLQRQHWLGQVLVSDFLRSRGKVRSHLLAFAVGLREIPRERRRARDRTTRLVAYLDAMSTAAGMGIKDIDRLTLAKRQLERKASGRRATSSLPVAVDLLMSRPIVSAHMIAKAAKITPRGALNLVGELGVREMTGRGRYRAWGIL
ncbi:RHE_PE00001 family protein [Notoacmeibacter sp. MSK16QG-6]|uniref:RHE_PE00001 family protein n=1 Tax=Notoacmeibacter sp. MSK16QG-6 TaxID=2957982 RepID=UPI00209CFF02|nr:RHE_PE00001 family protein [Notoacmeibacter sp. MSK16QG-6]MCP1201043.1 RHE_PE00001 family protein [Notoacmeibacter sp. MSK16QG-6]